MPKVIIFDFDGTILNSFDADYKIISSKIKGLTRAEFLSWFDGSVSDAIAKNGLEKEMPDVFKQFDAKSAGVSLVPGISRAIEELAKKYILTIVSSGSSVSIKKILKYHGLLQYFQEILGYDLEANKSIKIYALFESHGVKGNDCVYVTDTCGDILEMKKDGVESIAVSWGFHSADKLAACRPYAIVDDPSKLLFNVDQYFIYGKK